MQINNKVLTVSIAAYNMEALLPRALQSCIAPNMDMLEIIIVDDGSVDGTKDVAQQYVDKYPGVFKLISKENGGYGTTVNTSLSVATGKYFKILDADDWFIDGVLEGVINTLKNVDVDAFICPYVQFIGEDAEIKDQVAQVPGGEYRIEDLDVGCIISMHSVAFRTEALRKSGLRLPSHRLYTDVLYVTEAFYNVSSIMISHRPFYGYLYGREGQSVSLSSQLAHMDDNLSLIEDLIKLVARHAQSAEENALSMTMAWISEVFGNTIGVMLRSGCESETLYMTVHLLDGHPDILAAVMKQKRLVRFIHGLPRCLYRPFIQSYRLMRSY